MPLKRHTGPQPFNRSAYYLEAAEEMRQSPGDWFVIDGPLHITHAKRGQMVAFRPAGDFEFYLDHGTPIGRYVGPTNPA